ncbi:MAG: hypothetical protein ACRCZ0_06775 [Cetobacterium sp.]
MSCKIPIPTSKKDQSSAHHPKLSTYCYIKADKDHYDLQDLFGGKYIKSQEIWRFPKSLEQQVYNFLDCSSTESEENEENEENDDDINTDTTGQFPMIVEYDSDIKMQSSEEDKVRSNKAGRVKKRRDRLHRANSFNASDDSNDECDSLDENFRRHRQPIEKVLVESNKLKKEADKFN